MKTSIFCRSLFASLTLLVVGGCSTVSPPQAAALVTPLPKLTTAVVADIRYIHPGTRLQDAELVAEAIRNKPELQQAFAGYPLKVRHDAKNVVVVVCSPDGKSAWLEDASWTLGVDHLWYLSKPPHPAEFTMNPAQAPLKTPATSPPP